MYPFLTIVILTILFFAMLIEYIFIPRLDYTKEKKLLLWYGRINRRYIVLN